MLSVKDVVASEHLAHARIVAGHGGLSRLVRAVHRPDLYHLASERLDARLILLDARDLPSEDRLQQNLVQLLDMQQAAGAILVSDKENGPVYQPPASILEAANNVDFPLIVAKPTLALQELDSIIQAQTDDASEALHEVFDIHRQLSKLVLEGGNLNTLAQLLAQLVQRSVTIETPEMRVLAHADFGGRVDEARVVSIRESRTPAMLREALAEHGELEILRNARYPVVLKPRPELGMTFQRVVAPILVGNELFGYMWIIADERPLTSADNLALEGAALITALIMLRDRVAQNSKEQLRQEVLLRLLEDDLESVRSLLPQLRQFGLDLGQPSQVLICTIAEKAEIGAPHQLKQGVSDLMFFLSLQGLAAEGDKLVVALFSSNSQGLPGSHLGDALLERFPAVRIGLSAPCYTIGDIQYAYKQLRDALFISVHLGIQQPVITGKDIGYLNILNKVPPEAVVANPYYQRIESLRAYDEQHNTDLLRTLEVYLDLGGNTSHTAEQMSVHRGTVHYRLNSIAELLRVDLSDPQNHINLVIALKLFRLRDIDI